MKQHEIKSLHNVLDDKGRVIEAGFSRKEVLHYDKKQVKASRFRLKEWDYYFVGNEAYGLAITIADNNYMGLVGFVFLDFKNQKKYDYTKMLVTSRRHLNMPNEVFKGLIKYESKNLSLSYEYRDQLVLIKGQTKGFKNQEDCVIDLVLERQNQDHLGIVIPFKKKKAFYYNHKINHLKSKGRFIKGNQTYAFDDFYGVLDFGRGVWTYDNTWYWASASGLEDDKRIGFNLGYGFGITKSATENMIFYDGLGYKINDVTFKISDDYISPWQVVSSDDSLYFDFYPIYDNHTKTDFVVLGQHAHQVFGIFKGYVRIEGKIIRVNHLFGFAEKVRNKW